MRPRHSRRAAALAAVVLAAAVPAVVATSAGALTATTVAASFTPPLALLTSAGAGAGSSESSIDVDTKGNVYVSGPAGVPTGGCPFWTIHPDSLGTNGLPYDYRGTFDTNYDSVGGGDCDISTLPGTNGTTAPDTMSVSSLSLANLTTNVSNDGGKTFRTPANTVGQQVFGVDREWQAVDNSLGRTYLTVHDAAVSNIQISVSTDGGYAYVQNNPALGGTDLLTAQQNNHFGTTVVNQTTHKLYIPYIAPVSPTENGPQGSGPRHVLWVAEGDPCATVACTKGGPVGPITWTSHLAYNAPATQFIDHIFPAIGIDSAGTVTMAFTGDLGSAATSQIYVVHMTTPGNATTWTAPQQVSDPATHSNMFPWVIGGKTGAVAVVWYAATLRPGSGACPGGSSGTATDANGVNNNCFDTWRVDYASTTTGNAATPTYDRVVADPLVHNGSICDQGLSCTTPTPIGDRTLGDFFDVAIDPAGGANIAYNTDTATPGSPVATYTRQCTGPALAGAASVVNRSCAALTVPPVPGPTAVCSGSHLVTDPAGDVNNVAAGSSPTDDNADTTDISVADAGQNITVVETIKNLAQTPPAGSTFVTYYVTWTGPNNKQYAVSHTEPSAGPESTYTVGEFNGSGNQFVSGTTSAITGAVKTGANGTITWNVPKAKVGNPVVPVDPTVNKLAAPAMVATYGVNILGEGAFGSGLVFNAPGDRAPNAGGGPAWAVCASALTDPTLPEVPLPVLLLVGGLGLGGLALALRRRRTA